jgi:quercetin dioxygenase-like cupin family protein
VYKNELLLASRGNQTELYEIVFPWGKGLGAHIHTAGEDCALVLSGNLTYYVGNRETIQAEPGGLVFGWQNVLHGYLNQEEKPVQLVVFVTPGKIGLAYPGDQDPRVRKVPVDQRKVHVEEEVDVSSEYSSFRTILVDGRYEEPEESGVFKAFIDWKKRRLVVFDGEKVELNTDEPVRLLRYAAKS